MVNKAGRLPEVIIFGEFPYPTGSAASNNLRGHCLAIQQAGFSVGVLPNQGTGRPQDAQSNGTYLFRNVPYWPLNQQRPESPIRRIFPGFFGGPNPLISWLENQDLSGVKAIIVYHGYQATVSLLRDLRNFCGPRRVKLLSLVVEWHRPSDYKGPLGIFDAVDGEIQRRWVNPRIDGTICVSRYLQRYYEERGGRCVLIPPLLDLADPAWCKFQSTGSRATCRPFRLLFSGAYKRDRQEIILRAVHRLQMRGHPVSLEFLGATKDDITALPGVGRRLVEELGQTVVFHGRVPDENVYEIASSATFGILLRDKARWSEACFPSKVPEFLALGVPLLCNLTSDLAECLKDGHNGFVVSAVDVDSFCGAVERALALNQDQYQRMREAARITARQFDGSHFADAYQQILG